MVKQTGFALVPILEKIEWHENLSYNIDSKMESLGLDKLL